MSTDRQDHNRLGVAIAGLRDGFAQIGRVDIEDLTHLARVARSVLEGFVAAGILTDDDAEPDIRTLIAGSSLGAALASEPRTWTLPTIPEDVKALRDGDGLIWHRAVQPLHWETYAGKPPLVDEILPEVELWASAPLTEVLEDTDGR